MAWPPWLWSPRPPADQAISRDLHREKRLNAPLATYMQRHRMQENLSAHWGPTASLLLLPSSQLHGLLDARQQLHHGQLLLHPHKNCLLAASLGQRAPLSCQMPQAQSILPISPHRSLPSIHLRPAHPSHTHRLLHLPIKLPAGSCQLPRGNLEI